MPLRTPCRALLTLLVALWCPTAGAQTTGDVRVTKAPKLVHEVTAEYTEAGVRGRIEGAVKLRLTISETGAVHKVELLAGLGHGLDEVAVAAARQFVFEPAEINNQPATVALTFTINFSLPILPATLSGRVRDRDTGAGVAATVALRYLADDIDPRPQASASTTADGGFTFTEIPPGPYEITVQIPGYDEYRSTATLPGGEVSEVSYRVAASPENVTGRVRAAGTRAPLAAIRVQLLAPESGGPVAETLTDEDGRFAFRGVVPGSYTLRLAAAGYQAATAPIDVVAGEVTDGQFRIEARYYDEYEVRTVARQARGEVSRRRLELEEARRIPGTGNDIVRVVQNLPGVARAPGLSGLLIVRGSAPQDTRVYLDGDEIPAPYHFLGGPAVINSEMIDSLEFFPGNFSTAYGRSIGGVVDLSTRSPNKDRVHVVGEVDLLDATLLVEAPITRDFAVALSGRASYFGALLPLVLPDDGPDVFIAPRYYDGQAWFTWTGFDDHLLELLFYLSDDKVEVLFPPDAPVGTADVVIDQVDFANSFYRGQFKWRWRPQLPIENDFFISYGTNAIAFDAAENFFFNLDYMSVAMREDMRLKFSDAVTLRMGFDNQFGIGKIRLRSPTFQDADLGDDDGSSLPIVGEEEVLFERTIPVNFPAVYVEPEIRPHPKLLLTPGVRVDHFGQLGRTTVSPRLSTRWDLADRWSAKGGVGLFTQMFSNGSEDRRFGNPELKPEKAIQYSVGGEWRPLEYLELDVTTFYRDLFDLVDTTDVIVATPDGGSRPLVFDNGGEGRAFGAEVLLRHYPQHRFFGWVAYTLGWSQRLNRTTGRYAPYDFDQRHIFTFVGGYNLPKGFDVSARFRVASGNPFTPIIGSALNADTGNYAAIYGETHSERQATFHQLDVRLDKKFVFRNWLLSAFLDVSNAYNHVNAEGLRYNFDYTDVEPVRGLPIIPTIGVRGEFWADGPIVGR